ncbi:MAG: PIN domain-containing protein [Burkholderiales bacterium]|nr:PIN domain-containing protein [Burkholderiales bacterium]
MTFAHPSPTAVLDTNVVLDWFVFRDPAVAPLAQAIESGRLRWLCCEPMRAELAHVLARGRIDLRGTAVEDVLTSSLRWQLPVELSTRLPETRLRCSDSSDQMFLDLALQAGATWLISRDRALLALRRKAARLGLQVGAPAHWAGEPPARA